ncbi:MAG: CoB--CoM heterodisulfide reductase iron-sulfur subunit B family protein [Promethearchaeota archaeon]|jgi:heterodisulfide reductase subunit B
MKYALFLGCTIPARGQKYELSAREVAQKLDVEFVNLEDFACCGTPIKSSDFETSIFLSARNIAIAGAHNLDICTLCSSCTSVLTEANIELNKNKKLRDKVNEELKKIGLVFKSGVRIKHFARILYEDVGLDRIKKEVKKDLSELRLAIHYGCHFLRPSEIYDGFDNAENPSIVHKILEITGVKIVDYKNKLDCCGGAILGVDKEIALTMAHKKLKSLSANNVDALVTLCPFCTVMYEDNQRNIESEFEIIYGLPVLYYSQVLGLAFGIDSKSLGFRLNKVKAAELIEKIGVD